MSNLDFTQPDITVVEKSTKGKSFFIYGTNRTGKTENAVKFPKPFALPFEKGLNAIAGLPYFTPTKWADTNKIIKQFKRAEVKEMYETIIVDTADKMGEMLVRYICSKHGVENIGDANNGFGAYQDITKYLNTFIDGLINEGYTVVIIGHDNEKQLTDPHTGEKYTRIEPRGDKRVIQAICDAVDVIGYCQSNGFDTETGDELLSSIYLKDAKYFKAGSRWRHIPKVVTPFTVEGLTNALVEAIEKQEKEDGTSNYTQIKEKPAPVVAVSFEEVRDRLQELYSIIKEKTGSYELALEMTEDKLGEGIRISDTTRKHQEVLEELLEDMEERVEEL